MADLLRFRDDTPCTDNIVELADWEAGSNATAVRINPGADARALLPHLEQLSLIEITFPAFGDGRGYSSARLLREHGFAGEIRASGDVLVDQLAYMRRCGFDAFAPEAPLDPEATQEALDRWDHVYQKTVDGREPIWATRHG